MTITNTHPEKCPITRRDFFMVIEHPELGLVPTYGGPFDSYTIPEMGGEPTQPWHERPLHCERYDHDGGYWIEGGEDIPMRIINEDVLDDIQEKAVAHDMAALTETDLPRLRSLVRFILENAGKFSWSLQGFGMLRLHLPGETRLHVWDSRHAFANVSTIHDHLQWGLSSTIVSGRLVNHRFTEGLGDPYMAVTLKPGENCHFKDAPSHTLLRRGVAEIYISGDTYAQEPNEIHESVPDIGTITLMRKYPTPDGDSARVFWPAGEKWGTAEPRPATTEEVTAITSHALQLLITSITPIDPEKDICRVCGCTWHRACAGGCYWVEPSLCSTCAGK